MDAVINKIKEVALGYATGEDVLSSFILQSGNEIHENTLIFNDNNVNDLKRELDNILYKIDILQNQDIDISIKEAINEKKESLNKFNQMCMSSKKEVQRLNKLHSKITLINPSSKESIETKKYLLEQIANEIEATYSTIHFTEGTIVELKHSIEKYSKYPKTLVDIEIVRLQEEKEKLEERIQQAQQEFEKQKVICNDFFELYKDL